ncbi:MAG: molybdate ABC transporter substrate-binding protein, partial [Pseudomonadota bacterium]
MAIAAFVLSAAFSPKETRASDVVVFAAASLKNAMDQVGGAFAAETGMSVTFSYAGTATLARQIEQGAPADLIAAAHPVWIDYLAERGLVEPGSAVDFASNRLVLIAPKEAAATTDEPLSGVLLELPELLEAAGGNAR